MTEPEIIDLARDAANLAMRLRAAVEREGRLGPIPHALNLAASHAQDCLGQLYVAKEGGSPGIDVPKPRG